MASIGGAHAESTHCIRCEADVNDIVFITGIILRR